ncbi:TonB-dependent receptor [Pedobacter sp. KBW06]|uniref:TonB-dependent receptor n=1 Tax=Pedobacter sp. KBW06 TaxID=2153359 RepID=UPI0013150BCD|nr:TonB-dependent receptor [Pedobacter sp. KBW06]
MFLLVTIFQGKAASFAQRVTLNVKNAPIELVFESLTKQTNYNFYYPDELIRKAQKINLSVKDVPLIEVLKQCFSDQPFTYSINKNIVVLRAYTAAEELERQEIIVSGKVTDDKGVGIPGATIKVKGTNQVVTTNAQGNFSIRTVENAVLVVSYIGFSSQEVTVQGRTTIDITLKQSEQELAELVVVGYGTRKRSDLTGAISTVDEKRIREIPAGNVASALQGSAPGVSVLKSGGNSHPGSPPSIRIRGERSLGAGNDPLIILDGIPFNGNLNDISQDDVVSATILKDASSTAIYGSRGANGVILINTRRGKNGKPVVNYNGYVGFNKTLGEYDVMDAEQFLLFRKWARINGSAPNTYTGIDDPSLTSDEPTKTIFSDKTEYNLYKAGMNTNWQDLLYKTALLTNHQIGVSGGTDATQYDVSVGYYTAGGIYPGQGMDRYSVKLSIDHKLGNYIKVGLSSLNSYNLTKGINLSPVSQFLQASPFSTPYLPDGTLSTFLPGSNMNVWNPLSDFKPGNLVDDVKRLNTFTTAYLEADFTNGLKYKLNAGIELSPETQGKFYGSNTTKQLGTQNYGYNRTATGYNYTVENILTYDKTIAEDHALNFTGLFSLQKTRTEVNDVSYRDVLADYIQYYNPRYASSVTSSGDFNKASILSYMGRLNYTYKNKYLLTATLRADGSSRLADGNKWHSFPSAAVGWNIKNESFLQKNKTISALKLRGSYGRIGNQAIGSYETLGGLTGIYYNYGGTNVQGTYPNPDAPANITLGWEYTSTLNLGLDYGLFNNRITGSVEYYQQKTSDILLYQTLPRTSGYNRIRNNIGNTENNGMEFNLSTINFEGSNPNSFKWTTDLNVFFNRNKISKLASGVTRDLANSWFVGSPNGVFFDYQRVGLWQNTPEDIALAIKYGLAASETAYLTGSNSLVGTVKVADVTGDNKITADDRVILGSRQPKLEGGMTNRFTYKNFDFSFVAYFKYGGKLKSGIHGGWSNTFQAGYNNLDVDYWIPDNPVNYWPKPNSTLQNPVYKSTLDLFDASYLKIRTMTLGYTFSGKALKTVGAKSARIYATASNPFTFFSPYMRDAKGLDPETNRNIDEITPSLWSMLFGLNVSF